jgi:hypothetical protein
VGRAAVTGNAKNGKQLIADDYHSLEVFKYEELQPRLREIRLLTALNASNDRISSSHYGLLEFQIEHVSLDKNPKYTALSYTWGSTEQEFPILLNGKLFFITHNLDIALQHLKRHPVVWPIWVDAICINQENNKEKGEQVQQLRSIFYRAGHVIAWLGPAKQGEDEFHIHKGIQKLNELGKKGKSVGVLEAISSGEGGKDEKVAQLLSSIREEIMPASLNVARKSYDGEMRRILCRRRISSGKL